MKPIYSDEKDSGQIVLLNAVFSTGAIGATVGLDDRGYLDGPVNIDYSGSVYQFKPGIPKTLVKQVLLDVSCKTKAKLVEITANNIAFALGMNESQVVVWDGLTEYTKWWEADIADQQLLQFRKSLISTLEFIKLDHKGLVTAVDVPVFSDPDTEDPYVLDTDYFLNAEKGLVLRLPKSTENSKYSGTINSLGRVRAKYKCVPPAGTELPLKKGFLLWEGAVMITGTDASTNKRMIIYHPRALVTSGGLATNAKAAWGNDIEIEAADYRETPTYPLGYIIRDVESTA